MRQPHEGILDHMVKCTLFDPSSSGDGMGYIRVLLRSVSWRSVEAISFDIMPCALRRIAFSCRWGVLGAPGMPSRHLVLQYHGVSLRTKEATATFISTSSILAKRKYEQSSTSES